MILSKHAAVITDMMLYSASGWSLESSEHSVAIHGTSLIELPVQSLGQAGDFCMERSEYYILAQCGLRTFLLCKSDTDAPFIDSSNMHAGPSLKKFSY